MINAMNADLPYDKFLVEQIAADRLPESIDPVRPACLRNFRPAFQPPPCIAKAFSHLFDRTNMKSGRLFHRAPRARFTSDRKSAIRASKLENR